MAISINWGTKVINVPRADMLLLQTNPTEIRQLNLDTFRLELKDLEDSELGVTQLDTHRHNTSVTVGGVVLARVVEIINGYTVTFEDGQYAVNLVGANSNVGDVVNVNGVSVRSSNSAGLQDLSTILSAAYRGEVVIDFIDGQSGTDVPLGTRSKPVNNVADALVIAFKEGANTLRFARSTTLTTETIPSGFVITSDSAALVTITLEAAASVNGCEFENLSIAGRVDGNNVIRDCLIYDIDYSSGVIFNCNILGTIGALSGASCSLLNCSSGVAGGGTEEWITVDLGGANSSLIVRDFQGGIGIRNYSGGGAISLDMSSGRVIFESTVTAGTTYVRGIADVTDQSTGSAVIINQTINSDLDIINDGVKKASKLIPHNTDLT